MVGPDWKNESESRGGADLILSSSSINTFLRCGVQWEFAYVKGVKSPPSIKQAIGLGTHEALERNMEQKVRTHADLPLNDVLDAFSTAWDAMEPEIEPEESEKPQKAKDSGIKLVTLAHKDVAPAIQPIMVEEQVQFGVNGVRYSGTIDLVDDRHRVRDWKTASRSPAKTANHLLQMTGYALGYRQRTGQTESEVVLDYLVRKKVPEYLPVVSGGPISNQSVGRFAKVIRDVSAQINAGRFVPNGLSNGACSWCGYRTICPWWKEYRGSDV